MVATDLLQAERAVTSSLIIPTVFGLESGMTQIDVTKPVVANLRDLLLAGLRSRFAAAICHPLYVAATILDPRFKMRPWVLSTEAERLEVCEPEPLA